MLLMGFGDKTKIGMPTFDVRCKYCICYAKTSPFIIMFLQNRSKMLVRSFLYDLIRCTGLIHVAKTHVRASEPLLYKTKN